MAYRDYLSPEVVEPMIWKTLIAMEGQAVHFCQVVSGNLRNAITITTNKNYKRYGSKVAGHGADTTEISPETQPLRGVMGVAVAYGPAKEFGRPDMPNYPADPFLRPAADWMRSKLGIISGKELKVQMALYNIRHPYKTEVAQ